jgi:4-carboxymuconolactone decarboxylase
VRVDYPDPKLWPPEFISIMRLVDGLVRNLEVSDSTFAEARRHFDDPALIEVTQLVGLYVGVAMLVALSQPHFDQYRPGPPILAGAEVGS